MSKVFKLLNEVRKDEEGTSMVEYALLLGLIAVVSIVAVSAIGLAISSQFASACVSLNGTAC